MDWVRGFEFSVAGLVVFVVVVSGPLVGPVDFSQGRDFSGIGEGTATVGSITAPETVRIDEGGYGSEAYYLEVPPATVELRDVTGRPLLVYKLSIPELGYTRTTSHFLSENSVGRLELRLERAVFAPERIQQPRYDGELRIVLRANGDERVLYRSNVTAEVT